MSELVVEQIHKRLGGNEVLKGVSLTLELGEVVALLGHSGSGKTTLLRSVAGLETPDAGRVTLSDRTVFDAAKRIEVPPEKRGLGFVFQSYALWPNRRVFDTVAYGLRLRRAGDDEIRRRVGEVLDRLGLGTFAERYPHQLSGGQQQRVALARALVYQPHVLLLDEPLSNLDAKLREEARSWVRQLILQLQISALYVTHDQVEAMAVADRVLFLRDGRIEQEGTPQDMYERPASAITADFMGSNNRLTGTLGAVAGGRARLDGEDFSLWGKLFSPIGVGAAATAFIRLERTGLAEGPGENRLAMRLETSLYLGERWEYLLSRGALRVRAWGRAPLPPGECWVEFPPGDLWLF
jgi:iron(III) transport system ATP-binding protein